MSDFFSRDFFLLCGEYPCGAVNYFPVLTGIATTLIALFGVWRYFHEVKRDRASAVEERLWKHHQEARSFLIQLRGSKLIEDALRMIDYSSASYAVPDITGEVEILRIDREAVVHGLRVSEMTFSKNEEYIRKCFDELLVSIGEIDHFLEQGDVSADYFVPYLGYYASRLEPQQHVRVYSHTFGLQYAWDALVSISEAYEKKQGSKSA